jgi:hypothetical protein
MTGARLPDAAQRGLTLFSNLVAGHSALAVLLASLGPSSPVDSRLHTPPTVLSNV